MATYFLVSPQDHFERQLLASTRDEMFLCSPTGQVVRQDINEAMFAQDHFAGIFAVLNDLDAYCDEAEKDIFLIRNRIVNYSKASFRWAFFQETRFSGIPNPLSVAQLLRYWNNPHHVIPSYYDRNSYTISLTAYDLVRAAAPEWAVRGAGLEAIRPFEGWALCVRDGFFKTGWPDAMQQYLSVPGAVSLKPSGVVDVATMIVKAFGEGTVLTRDRAKFLFAKEMGPRPFRRAWEKAVEQRSQLSLPGPRSKKRAQQT